MTRSTPTIRSLGLLVLCLGHAGWSGAQQAAEGASGDTLGEIVVTAQKRTENLRDVPLSISVLEGGTLEQQHVQGFDAITRMTPGDSFSAAHVRGPTMPSTDSA
jgi:iron complex outermembrane receptor protein